MSSVVVYLESGQATDTLKEFVRHFCLQQSVLLPELPREHENGSYRLYVPPAEGSENCTRAPAHEHNVYSQKPDQSDFFADASPDGDALQAFEWASNPPGELEHA